MGGSFGHPVDDLVVVIPGILGSCLEKDGKQVWGTSARRLLVNLLTFGRFVKVGLAIPDGVDPDDPNDKVRATGLISGLTVIPGFLGMDFYDQLKDNLQRELVLANGQLVEFPYDWRLSSRVNGAKLTEFLVQQLEAFRGRTGRSDVRAILVCHSMGGLVARWCVEKAGGGDLVSTIITIGTPHKGSVLALDAIVNGVKLPRKLGVDLSEMALSFPSIYELLPTYGCVSIDGAEPAALGDEKVAARVASLARDGAAARISRGLSFHSELEAAISQRGPSAAYDLICFRGAEQPTPVLAEIGHAGLTTNEEIHGVRRGGDGVVPDDSAVPPEWPSTSAAKLAEQKHSSMANAKSIGEELRVILRRSGKRMSAPVDIASDAPAVVDAGESVTFSVSSLRDGTGRVRKLQLCARAEPLEVEGEAVKPVEVAATRKSGDTYSATLPGLRPGLYRLVIETAATQRAVAVNALADPLVVVGED